MSQWKSLGPWEGKPATVFPLNDLREHDPDDRKCWCQPRYEDGILIHNSMDRREEFECGRKAS